MTIYKLPDFLIGQVKDPVNVHFYQRDDADNLDKLKLNITQNMLCFMIKGHKDVVDEAHRYSISSDDIGLLPTGNILMTERTTVNREYESLLLFFSNSFLTDFLEKYNIRLQSPASAQPPVLIMQKDDYLVNFQQSVKLLKNVPELERIKTAKLEEVLLYLLQKYPAAMQGFIAQCVSTNQNRSLVKVVKQNMLANLNYQELAFLCNMSVSTFKRKFFEVYQTTPKKYFVGRKMQLAESMLQSKKRPSDIYFELGYENLSSFSLEFKKHFGISPKAYQVQN